MKPVYFGKHDALLKVMADRKPNFSKWVKGCLIKEAVAQGDKDGEDLEKVLEKFF